VKTGAGSEPGSLRQVMGGSERVLSALGASLHWYEAMCDAHGCGSGERFPSYWEHRGEVPPYHSRFISLRDVAEAPEQLRAIRELMAEGRGFTVKDSFQCLPLRELGFEELFSATWIHLPTGGAEPRDQVGEPSWRAVRTSDDLVLWERVWRGVPDNAEAPSSGAVFQASLLERADMLFLLGSRGERPVATAALNLAPSAVGLSNVFSAEVEPNLLFGGVVRASAEHFPGLPLVGYERGASLEAALAAGLEAVGNLTVWDWHPSS
jgi:hypothetical protein